MTNPVILDVCQRRGITVDDFFSRKRSAILFDARAEAARTFRSRGQSWEGTARLMKRSHSAIRYLLNENRRMACRAHMRRQWHEVHKFRSRNETHADATHSL